MNAFNEYIWSNGHYTFHDYEIISLSFYHINYNNNHCKNILEWYMMTLDEKIEEIR